VFGARTEGLPSQTHHEVDQLLNESMDVLRHDPVPAFALDRVLCMSAVKSEVVESLRGYGDHKPSAVADFVSEKQFEIEPPIRSFRGAGHRSGGRPRTPGEGWRRLVIQRFTSEATPSGTMWAQVSPCSSFLLHVAHVSWLPIFHHWSCCTLSRGSFMKLSATRNETISGFRLCSGAAQGHPFLKRALLDGLQAMSI